MLSDSDEYFISVLLNQGDGTFGQQKMYKLNKEPSEVVVSDFDHDGNLDVVISNVNSSIIGNHVTVFLNKGDGSFSYPVSFTVGVDPLKPVASDLNNDGFVDIVVLNAYSGDFSVLINTGTY